MNNRGLKDMVFDSAQKKWVKKEKKYRGTRGQTASVGAQCGAKKRGSAGKCTLAAGWGTNHPGTGKCKFHGGSMPNHVKAAATAELRTLLGKPIDINPYEAIMWCIRIRGGEVKWLTEKISELEATQWTEEDNFGQRQLHLWARERQAAMNDLVRFSQIAVSLGIAERAVRLAEVYGDTISILISGILAELEPFISDEGRSLIPQIVRRHVMAMESGSSVIDLKALPAGEESAA